MWHILLCAGCGALGLLLGFVRGHLAGYSEGFVDGTGEHEAALEVDEFLKGETWESS